MTATTRTTSDRVGALLNSGRLAVSDSGLRTCGARVRSAGGDDVLYRVRIHCDGWWSCTCRAGVARPTRRCKHVKALIKVAPWSLRAALSDDRRDRPAGEEEESA